MKTAEIRQKLLKMREQHGQLQAFANRHKLVYNRLIKFLNKPHSQMWHDHALDIVAALEAEQSQPPEQEAA